MGDLGRLFGTMDLDEWTVWEEADRDGERTGMVWLGDYGFGLVVSLVILD